MRFVLFVLTSLLVFTSNALSGSWQVSYDGGQWRVNSAGPYPYSLDSSGRWGGGGTSASGTIHARFQWQGGGTPPDHVYILETCTASGTSNTGQPTPTADNGLGDEVTTQTWTVPPQTCKTSTGSRLTYFFTGGTQIIDYYCSPAPTGGVVCSVRYKVQVVDKSVYVSCDRDETFHKGPDGFPESHFNPAVVSPRFGDTWVDPQSAWYTEYEGWRWLIEPTFSCNHLGFWTNPFHDWLAGATHWNDDLFHEYESVTPIWWLTSEEYSSLSYGPITKPVKLSVSDEGGSGLTAVATYTFRIHHRYEHWRKVPGSTTIVSYPAEGFTVASPGWSFGGGGIMTHWTKANPYWSVVAAELGPSSKITSAVLEDPLYKILFIVAGIAAEDVIPGQEAETTPAPWAWQRDGTFPESRIYGGKWTDTDWENFRMIPYLQDVYELYRMECDKYGRNGFIGLDHDAQLKPTGAHIWYGDFYRLGTPGCPA